MKTKAITTIVITLFLVSIAGMASTASAKKPKVSPHRNRPGENLEVRAELMVDPNGLAAAKGLHPRDLDILELALLSSGSKNVRILKKTVRIDLLAGKYSVLLRVKRHLRVRDLNGDGINDDLIAVDMADAREEHRELSGFNPYIIRVGYVSSVGGVSKGRGKDTHSFEASASLLDAAMTTDDVSTFCYANGDVLNMTESITCHFESSTEDIDVKQLVSDLNLWIDASIANIPDNAQTVIEAYAGKGPPQRHKSDYCNECYPTSGEPGAPGYAATAVTLDELDLLSIYVGQNGKADTFGAGSASLVSSKRLHDISVDNRMKPREAGIMVIAGSGGVGGGWNTQCKAWPVISYCHSGRHGYDGGQAPLSVDKDVSAAGGGGAVDKGEGEGGNLDGEGYGGYGGNADSDYYPSRDGQGGIGGFGGMDQYSDDYQSVFEGVDFEDFEWFWGAGGDSYGNRGDTTGGGGFGGGGAGGMIGRTKCGGGGGGSWSRQATIDPDRKLVHGANEHSDPTVLITFEVVSLFLDYVADDDVDGDTTWQNETPVSGLDWSLPGNAARVSAENAPSCITHAYSFDGTGAAEAQSKTNLSTDVKSNPASFELWFKPTDVSGKQIIFESGGHLHGISLALDGGSLLFTMTDNHVVQQLSHELTTAEMEAFIHAVVTIDLGSSGTTTELNLYVNGTPVASGSSTDFVWWSYTYSNMGLGGYNAPGTSVGGNLGGSLDDFGNFNGEIAVFRLYDHVLTPKNVTWLYEECPAPLLDYVADNDVDGDTTWQNETPVSGLDFSLPGNAARVSAENAPSGITHAYSFDGTGAAVAQSKTNLSTDVKSNPAS